MKFKQTIKRVAFTATLLMLSTSVAYSANCDSYPSSNDKCACMDSALNLMEGGAWNVNSGTDDGSDKGETTTNVKWCANATDTTCSAIRPVALTTVGTGDVIYLKNISAGATDYFKCNVTLGSELTAVAYDPNPAPAPTAVPLSPLSKLLLALLFMGGSLFMLKRREAKA